MDEERDCCFDDWVDHWSKKTKRGRTAAAVTETLLDALEEAGVRDRTILDIGCGIGDLPIDALRRGASHAYGIELSAKAVSEARRLAAERGVGGRAEFTLGDGAEVALPAADVVVLNRVFCCYPEVDALVERSVSAARTVYAFTAPPSAGFAGVVARLLTSMSNAWYRLRNRKFQGFRVFVHDLDRVDASVRAAGFRPLRNERASFSWQLAVYERA